MKSSFDIIGSIAILPLYAKNAKKLAGNILKNNSHIKSVFMKAGKIQGRLRRMKLKWLAGDKGTETIHKESGCLFKLDVEKCYFSPRLANDRIDVLKQVKKNERVLVMFSGIGPYAVVIAKNTKAKEVYAVELNKIASAYALENAMLNKLNNLKIIQGDVKKILPKLARQKITFDRIMMARPQLKDDFLDCALKVSKKGTIIHFHDFLPENDIPDKAIEKIDKAVKLKKMGWKLLRVKRALEIGIRKWRIRVDFKII